MPDLLARITAWLLAHREWAGLAFGLLAFGESLAVLGIIIPATPVLFLVGTLLGNGTLDPFAVLPWAIIGAIVGYWLSWLAGRRVGAAVYRSSALAAHRHGIIRARLFFRRWGGPSLVFGRYLLGPFQSLLPLVAGVAAMPPRRFHIWNIVSGVVWVFVVLAPGYLAAKGFTLFGFGPAEQRRITLALLVVSVGLIVATLIAATHHAVRTARR